MLDFYQSSSLPLFTLQNSREKGNQQNFEESIKTCAQLEFRKHCVRDQTDRHEVARTLKVDKKKKNITLAENMLSFYEN